MEVHAHSHTPRKKWTHYLWEFLMLFLAVSASFFVENQREHYIERKKEKQFMVSMLSDLKNDIGILEGKITHNEQLIKGLDSLFWLLKKFPGDKASTRKLYQLFDNYAGWVSRARLADRTISQLKNSGTLRLIHVQEISDSILVYEERKKLLEDRGEGYKRENNNITDLSRKILDYRYFFPLDTASILSGQQFSAAVLFELANETKILKDQIDIYVDTLRELFDKASNIIALIQKHYHLK